MKKNKKDHENKKYNPLKDEIFDDISDDSPEQAFDIIDQDDSFFASPEALDEMLDEFEKATDDMTDVKPAKISVDDKKSASKKKLARTIFLAVAAIVVIASILIIIYAAKNNKTDEPQTVTPEPTAQEYITEEMVATEQDTTEALTTVATTNASTELVTVATTKAPTTVAPTVAPTTKPTPRPTAPPTTQAPTTTKEFTTAAPYTGRYVQHVIKYGDTFFSILREHGVSATVANVDTMCALNGITSYYLKVGSTINVPIDL